MKLVQQDNEVRLIGVMGEPSHRVRCTDRYVKPARWFFQTMQEVEIWTLQDGRQIRASRVRPTDEWALRWRSQGNQLR